MQDEKLQEENQMQKIKRTSSNCPIDTLSNISKANQSLQQKNSLKKGLQIDQLGHSLETSSSPDEILSYIPLFLKKMRF